MPKLEYTIVPIAVFRLLAEGFNKGLEEKGDSEYAMLKKGIVGYTNAIMRHWTAMGEGEVYDKYSKLPHDVAILCSAGCLAVLKERERKANESRALLGEPGPAIGGIGFKATPDEAPGLTTEGTNGDKTRLDQ